MYLLDSRKQTCFNFWPAYNKTLLLFSASYRLESNMFTWERMYTDNDMSVIDPVICQYNGLTDTYVLCFLLQWMESWAKYKTATESWLQEL